VRGEPPVGEQREQHVQGRHLGPRPSLGHLAGGGHRAGEGAFAFVLEAASHLEQPILIQPSVAEELSGWACIGRDRGEDMEARGPLFACYGEVMCELSERG
jgi:hypothetical protein